ncbi:hypothetical protein Ndes2437B_g05173 [Nannochloris sp. 'desiccata']|nr:hypothetical protein KSW81_003186 [Chlorella desiccata (nom. nud.)]
MGGCCSLPKADRPATYGAYERSQPTTSGAYYEAQPTTTSPSPSSANRAAPFEKKTTTTNQQQQVELDSGSPPLPASYPPQWQSPYETYFPPPVGSTAIDSVKKKS